MNVTSLHLISITNRKREMLMTASGENTEAAALAQTLTQESKAQETVPVHVVQSLRDELRRAKEEQETLKNHFQMMQWQNQQQPQQQAQFTPFQGRDPKDSILVEDAERAFNSFAHQLRQEVRSEIAEVKVASKTNDYKEVINKYLPKAAQEDPELINEIRNSPNPYKAAYLAAKASQAYQEDYATSRAQKTPVSSVSKASNDVDRMIHNSKQSGSLASVGNNANATPDGIGTYTRMSDDEFRKYKSSLQFKPAKGMR